MKNTNAKRITAARHPTPIPTAHPVLHLELVVGTRLVPAPPMSLELADGNTWLSIVWAGITLVGRGEAGRPRAVVASTIVMNSKRQSWLVVNSIGYEK